MNSKLKYIAVVLALAIGVTFAAASTTVAQTAPATSDRTGRDVVAAGLAQLRRRSVTPIQVRFANGFPRSVQARVTMAGRTPTERAGKYLQEFGALYGTRNRDLQLEVSRVQTRGIPMVRYVQTFRGVPVYGGELVVLLRGADVFATFGSLLVNPAADIRPNLQAKAAEDQARRQLGLGTSPVVGHTTLSVYDPSIVNPAIRPAPKLAWRVVFLAGTGGREVLVDARTGAVLNSVSVGEEHNGFDDYDLYLQDANGANAGDTNCYNPTTIDDKIGDSDSFDSDYLGDADAVDAWNLARDTYAFFHSTFKQHSYDNDGEEIEMYVHAGVPNAQWTPWCAIEFSNGFVEFDVMVHEFTHAVIQYNTGLFNQGQQGALNESYADVMAFRADDALIGEDLAGGPIRDMSNPPAFGQPDTMSGFVTTSADNGGVHINSGISNKAHFLMANGGSHNGRVVQAMGKSKMGLLAFWSLKTVSMAAQFIDARESTVALAQTFTDPSMAQLLGVPQFSAADVCSARNAWAAVEVGSGDADCDGTEDSGDPDNDGDFIADGPDNCNNVGNPSQTDTDGDGTGNACDDDDDNDGVADTSDNCPVNQNPGQGDGDGDGTGNACEDDDGDKVVNPKDNCPTNANVAQTDTDGDGQGDACDPDIDNDGIANWDDNCETVPNPDQKDTDSGGWGDVCDPNPDSPANEWWAKIGHQLVAVDDTPIPIEPCRCPDSLLNQEYRQQIGLEGLPRGAYAWISDAQATRVEDVAGDGGTQVLRFLPVGGTQYYLHFASDGALGGPDTKVGVTLQNA